MRNREDFDKMISLYQALMIAPLVNNTLRVDEYDTIEVIHSYNQIEYSVRFGAIRKRPDRYMIDKMYCVLADVSMLDIERWYDDYIRIIEKSEKWEWKYQV